MQKVEVRWEKVKIPTYEIGAYDKNPMFLEKRVYQGSSGRVYPHPVCEKVSDTKQDKEYQAFFLENEYLFVMILPELGGRIQRLLDKTNGYDAVYYNEVIKPALVGLAGPWISGGIEFNWPQHHRPSTYDPVDAKVTENKDGSVTVWVGETEKMFHTKALTGFTLYPDKAYLEIKGQIYNPTDRPQTFLWWANPAVAVNENTRSIFPPDVTAVYDHGKRDVSKFPIADGVYYKVDYAPGTDISRYKNIPVPTSYMAYHSDYDFIGNYDDGKRAGLLHIADHHVSPGKKQWTWGNGDFGKAWDRNLTDENGPYIELMTGMFTDNQPDFTFLKPYEEKSFTQYFMPYKDAGAVKNASLEIFLNMEYQEDKVYLSAYAPQKQEELELELLYDGQVIFSEMTQLSPVQTYQITIPAPLLQEDKLCMRAKKKGKVLLSYTPEKKEEECPEAAKPLPAPEKLKTTEQLFLAATHLEQYRHATYSPQDYYLEGLKRDNTDIRLNHGYGKYLYQKGLYAEAKPYVEQAIKSSTWKNPNPYDCEPYYTLGLVCEKLGEEEKSFDAFYKSAWDGAMQDKAFYKMACQTAKKGKYEQAYSYIEQSLQRGTHHLKARAIKTALLRKLGRIEEAIAFCKETMQIDPLDHAGAYEAMRLGLSNKEVLCRQMRQDAHNAIELSLTYKEAGFMEEAKEVLLLYIDNAVTPMSYYYLYAITGEDGYLQKAEQADSAYCFPNRLEDIEVLQLAVKNGGMYAAYYLGNLYYDRGRFDEAAKLWELCKDRIAIPTAYRNLALYYYNKKHEPEKARKAMETAFEKNRKDARVFFELDQLYKALTRPVEERLTNMEAHKELLETRDDLYIEYLTLLNLTADYEKAYEGMCAHQFHPWEGGEGKITTQYRYTCMRLAEKETDVEKKEALLQQALFYPHNLGEGKLAGNLDNDIYYLLGMCCKDTDDIKAKGYFRFAARGDSNLSSAMYYNDQPPQMQYYAALAKRELGMEQEAVNQLTAFIAYGEEHLEDEVKIDYFAVSLPDFLIFEGDLQVKNKVHCHLMKALGYLGLEQKEKAMAEIEKGLSLECCNETLLQLKEVCDSL